MTSKDVLEKLKRLTETERQVLARRCEGKSYKTIAEDLGIKLNTVKTHVGEIYGKLELTREHYEDEERRKMLFEVFCPALRSEVLPPGPPDDEEPKPLPPDVEQMVDDDERALMLAEPREVTVIPGPPRPRPRRRLWPLLLVIGLGIVALVAGGVVLGGLILDRLQNGDRVAEETPAPPTIAETIAPPTATVEEPSEQPAIIVTATPGPVVETATPAATPAPTDTAVPLSTSTPAGMVDEVHTVSGERSNTESGDGLNADPRSWYSTGVYVQEGDRLSINYLGGEWWIGKVGDDQFISQTPTDAGGYTGREEERVVAEMQVPDFDKCYVLRSAPIASLIGKIGENGPVFLVGNSYDAPANLTGILHLRINYNSRVGFAFHSLGHCPVENGGEISVRIEVIPRS